MKDKEGWESFSEKISHFYTRGKRFWNHHAAYLPDPRNPGFGRKEGYFYNYKSLCGKSDFLRTVNEKPGLKKRVGSKNTPCLRCLFILSRCRGIA